MESECIRERDVIISGLVVFIFAAKVIALFRYTWNRYIVCSESGNILIWNRLTEQVVYKESQPGVVQVKFLEDGTKFFAISKPQTTGTDVPSRVTATCVTRIIPSRNLLSWPPIGRRESKM